MGSVERKDFGPDVEKDPISAQVLDEKESHESPDTSEPRESHEIEDLDCISSSSNANHDEPVFLESPVASRTTSSQSQPIPVQKIPRSSRAGLLGRFSLLYEAENPKHYPRNVKWFITFIIAFAAVAAPMGSALILRKALEPPNQKHHGLMKYLT